MSKIRSITTEQVIARMRLENPWWVHGGKFSPQSDLPRRLYFDRFFEMVRQSSVQRALVLMGPRRVGKTVMLHQLIKQLLEDGSPRNKVCYLSIDAPIYNNQGLEQLFALCRSAAGDDDPAGYTLIFDEIQYLKEWEIHLKTMVDFFPQTRIIVSGSAAAALRLKSTESGAGRFTDFMLPPLTFQEYLHLKGLTHLVSEAGLQTSGGTTQDIVSSKDFTTLNHHFLEYLNYGGYPEVIFNEMIRNDPGRFIRSDIIDKVLLRDLPSLYGIRDVQELNSLFNVIAWNSGNEFNLEGLSQESGVDKNTIRRYLEYLEAAFLVKSLYPVDVNSKRFQRASRFKLFLTNPSMRCALFTPVNASDEQFGQMVETAIVAQYLHWSTFPYPLHYAAWNGGEVDLIAVNSPGKPAWAVEIKWSNQFYSHPGKLRSLLKYASENQLKTVWATTIDKEGIRQQSETEIIFLAAACFCFAVGRTGLRNSGLTPRTDSSIDL